MSDMPGTGAAPRGRRARAASGAARWSVALLLLAGCTTPTTSGSAAPIAAATAEASAAATPDAWFDRVCAAGITVVTPAVAVPSVRGNHDTRAVKQALLDYMDSVLAGIREGRAELDAAGPSPVQGGDAAVTRARALLDQMERQLTDGRAQIAAADPANPHAFALTVGRVHRQLTSTNAEAEARKILATPGLVQAAAGSTQCSQLEALVAAAPG